MTNFSKILITRFDFSIIRRSVLSFLQGAENHNQSKSYPLDEQEGKRKNRQSKQNLTEEQLLRPNGK